MNTIPFKYADFFVGLVAWFCFLMVMFVVLSSVYFMSYKVAWDWMLSDSHVAGVVRTSICFLAFLMACVNGAKK